MFNSKIILLLGVFFLPIVAFSQEKLVDNDSILSWDKDRKLKWEDFSGFDDSKNLYTEKAVTASTIIFLPKEINIDEYHKINALAIFHKKMSWTSSNSRQLLQHEQIHFDISELFARKIRKLFEDMKKSEVTDIKHYIKNAEILGKEHEAYQIKYDTETDHGKIYLSQKEWENKIADELSLLEEYRYE